MDFQAAAMLRLRPFFAIRGMRGVLISCWIVWGVPGFNGGGWGETGIPFLSWGSGRSLVFQAGRRVGEWESGYKDKLAQG